MVAIYTDGSCRRNSSGKYPGPASCGIVVVRDSCPVEEKGVYIGPATNNVAELEAFRLAIQWIRDHDLTKEQVSICSDSAYALGMVLGTWKPSQNRALVYELRELAKGLNLLPVKVVGHSGDQWNDRVDSLCSSILDKIASDK
jgi:ribonuclease HI